MTDHTLDASVVVDLEGNLQQQSRRYESALQNMSRNGSRHMGRLQRTTQRLDTTMSRLGNRWVALATGGSVIAAGKMVGDFDARLTRMQTSARMSDEQIAQLKERLQTVANDQNVRVPIDELTNAVAQFLDKTGDADYAIDQLQNMGMMMQGLGVEAQSAGLLLAQFWEDGIRDPKDVMATLDRLFAQFSRGSVPVADIARVSAELFSTVQRQGPDAISEIGALAQVYAKTAGNADKAQTALKATVRVLNDGKKAAVIDKALAEEGLQPIRDAEGLIRSLPQLLLDITRVANDSVPALSRVFDGEALDGLKSLVDARNKALLMDMVNGVVEQNLTLNASTKNARTAAAAMNQLSNAGRQFADLHLSGPIEELAEAITALNSAEMRDTLDTVKDIAIATGTAIVGLKLLNKGAGVLAKRNNGGGALGDAASNLAPIPVFVVNNIAGGGMPGGAGGGKPGTGHAGKAGRLAKLGGVLTFLGGATGSVLGTGMLGYGAGSILNELIEGTAFHDWVGATVARTLAAFGNENAQAAVNANGDAHSVYGSGYAKVELELSPEASKALKPKKAEAKELELDINGTVEGM